MRAGVQKTRNLIVTAIGVLLAVDAFAWSVVTIINDDGYIYIFKWILAYDLIASGCAAFLI